MYWRLAAMVFVIAAVLGLGGRADAQANQKGEWSSVINWSLLPVHSGVLGDGRVITYGANSNGDQGGFAIDVWDPATNTNSTVNNTLGSDLFCSFGMSDPSGGGAMLIGGEIVGSNRPTFTSLFNGSALTDFDRMNDSRWYPTATTLWDGRTLVQGGVPDDVTNRPSIKVAEVHTPGVGWQSLEGTRNPSPAVWATSDLGWWYPKSFVTPAGRVWNMAFDRMFYIDPDANNGDGTLTQIGDFPTDNVGATSAAVMFDVGMVLQFGGGQPSNTYKPADGSKKASIINLNVDPPTITPVPDMTHSRHWPDGIVLPDGKVLVIGGSQENNREDLGPVAYEPELYDPVSNTWTVLEPMATPRLYHSSAVLLADGRVFVAGGGAAGSVPDYPSVEIFSPPNLFNSNGNLAARPQITSAPSEIGYGHTFNATVNGSVDRVTLLKVNHSTHNMNTQNFMELPFTQSGNTLTIDAPTLNTVATPGDYMLFALDSNGVPSEAAMMRVWAGGTPPPNVAPTASITTPATNGEEIDAMPTISGDATDTDGTIAGVELTVQQSSAPNEWLQADGSFGPTEHVFTATLANPSSASTTWTWTPSTALPAGDYDITATAVDDDGDPSPGAVRSATVAANELPTSTISTPATDGEVITPLTTFEGTASDTDGTIQRVEISILQDGAGGQWLQADGTSFGPAPHAFNATLSAPPNSAGSVDWSWANATPLSADDYVLHAVAVDDEDGAQGTPTTRSYTVAPPPDSVCPSVMALGNLRDGIAATDTATGTGYLMWSEHSVHTRFAANRPHTRNADHLIAVVWTGTHWTYDNRREPVPFIPNPTDCLLAQLDFTNDTATTLQGTTTIINGIDSGYTIGDLTVTPNRWSNNRNNGEFQATGTQVDHSQ
ncbi:MAG: galactose oxidase-like domain-containing protein [Actinomycetota bacterium]